MKKAVKKAVRRETKVDEVVRFGKSHVTGTTTIVVRLGAKSKLDETPGWGVLCEAHGVLLVLPEDPEAEVPSTLRHGDTAFMAFYASDRATAAQYGAHPERFCADCADRAEEREEALAS